MPRRPLGVLRDDFLGVFPFFALSGLLSIVLVGGIGFSYEMSWTRMSAFHWSQLVEDLRKNFKCV